MCFLILTYSGPIQIFVAGPPEANIDLLLGDVLEKSLPRPPLDETLQLLPLRGELLDEEERVERVADELFPAVAGSVPHLAVRIHSSLQQGQTGLLLQGCTLYSIKILWNPNWIQN